jgi:hypothetical protein
MGLDQGNFLNARRVSESLENSVSLFARDQV